MKKIGIISIEDSVDALNREQVKSPHRILVVNDDKDMLQLSVDILVDAGYEVESAPDGAAGWEALQTRDYHLVITDNRMPIMTGLEMIEKLRDARMFLAVIMATSQLPTYTFSVKPWLRPNASLQRPFSNADLLAAVKKVLSIEDTYSAHINMLLPNYL